MKRDLENKLIFGVCAGMAKELSIDPVLVRLLFVFLTLIGFGLPFVIYIIAALIMPASEN